jgi:hypothetical protein
VEVVSLRWQVMTPPRGFRAYLTREHDGDSFWVMCDTAGDQRWEPELRLLNVHAPELETPGGVETTAFVNGWLSSAATRSEIRRRWPLWVETVLTKAYEPTMKMTFTRYLATVWEFEDAHRWPVGSAERAELSLNWAVTAFLAEHPVWGGGA